MNIKLIRARIFAVGLLATGNGEIECMLLLIKPYVSASYADNREHADADDTDDGDDNNIRIIAVL